MSLIMLPPHAKPLTSMQKLMPPNGIVLSKGKESEPFEGGIVSENIPTKGMRARPLKRFRFREQPLCSRFKPFSQPFKPQTSNHPTTLLACCRHKLRSVWVQIQTRFANSFFCWTWKYESMSEHVGIAGVLGHNFCTSQ